MKLEVGWAVKFVSRTSCFWDAQSYCRRAPARFHAHARSRGSGPRSIRELTYALLFIIELAKIRIPKRLGLDPIRDVQVLCPMNRGGVGARSLNIELQKALNPAGDRKVERFGWTFTPGDKVMQIENDYDKEVYNGDIGHIVDVDPSAGEIVARFDDRSITYGFGELDTLVPAYAATIHKSQGSEYPAVIIPVLTQHYAMLQRNLFYTGVTRGKRLVVLVGQKKAIAIAVRNMSGRRRWSKLGGTT